MSKIVKEFMDTHSYSDYTDFLGVRRDYKKRENWTFDSPTEVLKKFHEFLKTKEK